MPLFKVLNADRTQRVPVCASTLAALSANAVRKLELSAGISYKVYDDSDGTLIDDDECLSALADFYSTKGEHLNVYITEGAWFTVPRTPSTPSSNVYQNSPTTGTSDAGSHAMINAVLPALPYKDFGTQLRAALAVAPALRNKALIRARRGVVKAITLKVKNKSLSKGAVRQMCEKIEALCPEAFTVQIHGSTSPCFKPFVSAVYNALSYARDADGTTPRRRRLGGNSSSSSSSSEGDVDDPEVPYLCTDTNGCADGMWEPELLDDDVEEQESLRKTLLSYLGADDDPHVLDLVKRSFPLQRMLINRARTAADWTQVFTSWPVLNRQGLFLAHANLLMGKSTQDVWNAELSSLRTVRLYFKDYLETRKVPHTNKDLKYGSWLAQAEEASESLLSATPWTIAAIPLLLTHFQEKEDNFFLLVDALLTPEEILEKSLSVSQCPLLVVKGPSIFDESAETFVAVRGKFLIKTKTFMDSTLILILSYFVFNIQYPKIVARSLEFLQRYILQVNPTAVRGKKGTNPAVLTLAGRLADFEHARLAWTQV